jgi:hypothetical protein
MLDKKAYADFLQNNCPAAYSQYKKGKKLIGAGWGLFATGLTLSAGGAACMILADVLYPKSGSTSTYDEYSKYDYDDYMKYGGYDPTMVGSENTDSNNKKHSTFMTIGISLLAAGGTMTVVSIPLLGTGYSKRNSAYKVYNKKCSSPSIKVHTMDVKVGPQTVGLAFNF